MCKVMSPTELQRMSDKELCVLFNVLSEALYECAPGSPEARAVYTSLDNVRREVARRAARQLHGPKPPGF